MDSSSPSKISVIVTTYNWPYALRSVLTALAAQKSSSPFEIIIADDGSGEETAKWVRSFKKMSSIPILHIWQPDEGFRAAAIRNKAILAAEGDYIVFLDGDCIPRDNFISQQQALAEPGTFVVGNRILLSRMFTLRALSETLPLHEWPWYRWMFAWASGHCNRFSPFLPLHFKSLPAKSSSRWQGAKGCNLAVWKADLLKINGWEEKFVGWGYEDSDLVIRLLRLGIARKNGRFRIPVIHLWHPESDRAHEKENWQRFKSRLDEISIASELGLSQYETHI